MTMAETGMVIPLIITFVVVAIILFVGVTILGNVNSGFDCKLLTGYDKDGSNDAAKYPTGTWSGTCFQIGVQSQSAYNLLVVSLIIIAAVVILYVVRTFA